MKRRTALATAGTVTFVLFAGAAAAQATGLIGDESPKPGSPEPVATVADAPTSAATTVVTPATLPPVVVTRQEYDDTYVVVTTAPGGAPIAPAGTAPAPAPGPTAAAAAAAPAPPSGSAAPGETVPDSRAPVAKGPPATIGGDG